MLEWSDAARTAEADLLFMLRALAHRLLPRRCVVCEMSRAAGKVSICEQCEADFFFTSGDRCERCAISVPKAGADARQTCGRCLADPPHYDATTTLADYVSPVDGMVTALKFKARLDLARFFGQMLGQRLASQGDMRHATVIPVPLAFERVRQRGFNQSQQIAHAVAAATRSKLVVNQVLRVRHTVPQQWLALKERQRNVRGAFAVEGDLAGQSIFLVDDVMTSGSTVDEIARVLKRAGAARVHNLIVARTPLP